MSISDRFSFFLPRTSAQLEGLSNLITTDLEQAAWGRNKERIWKYHKAATAFFPYAVWKERRCGDPRTMDAFLGVAVVSDSERATIYGPERFMWKAIEPFITVLFNEASPHSLNRIIVLVSPHILWDTQDFNESAITRWAVAASAVPYTEVVGHCVVDTLLQIASVDSLRPYIPIGIWAWLNKQPLLSGVCLGRRKGTEGGIVYSVRALGNVEILKSYLLLVWSEYDSIPDSGFTEMCASIREDFSGIGMGHHREDLVKRLDHVQGQLDQAGHGQWPMSKHCKKFKKALLEVDREALEILTRKPSRLTGPSNLLTPADVHRIPLNICLCTPSPISVILVSCFPLCTSFMHVFYPLSHNSSLGSSAMMKMTYFSLFHLFSPFMPLFHLFPDFYKLCPPNLCK